MSDPLTKAMADSDRSYQSAKQSVGSMTQAMMARGPSGVPVFRPELHRAQDQYRHFRDWVYASIRPIAQRIAGQPIHVGRATRATAPRTSKRHQPINVEPFENHELLDLFHDPNGLMVAWSLMFSTVAGLELTGRQLWWLPRKKQILPIPTHWIKKINGATKLESFSIRPPHAAEDFDPIPADECVYFSYPNPADPHGVTSPLQATAGAVEADEQMTRSQVEMFRQGIHPTHAVKVGKNAYGSKGEGRRPRLTGSQERQIIAAIRRRFEGAHKHHEPVILDGLIEDVFKLSNTPSEMDWQNSQKSTKARISQTIGTNPIIMGEIEGANRASAMVADRHFCDFTINPKIELLSQVLTAWLRPIFGQEIVVWIEPCVANDAEMQLKWAQALAKHSAVTGDELRELSPFDLELGSFPDAVSSQGRDQQLDEVNESLQESMRGLRSFEPEPFANRIAEKASVDVRVNGRK